MIIAVAFVATVLLIPTALGALFIHLAEFDPEDLT